MPAEIVLGVRNLRKYYGEVKAVNGISFEVKRGKCLAILGPNGAGKTTTVEILEGLRKPDAGEIYYFGKPVKSIDASIKERIGVQLQTSAFLEHLTVKETLDFFGGLYSKRLPSEELIKLLSLEEKVNARVKGLSGGQLQRLAVAVALINDPEIVYLDEPTTGMDPQARRMLWNTVEDLKKRGKTVLLTTHYMEEAEYLADKVLIIDHGKIIAEGTVEDLIRSISEESIIEFSLNGTEAASFETLKKLLPDVEALEEGRCMITTNKVEESLSKLFEKTKNTGFAIDDIVIRRPNLEDVFLKLTGRSLRD